MDHCILYTQRLFLLSQNVRFQGSCLFWHAEQNLKCVLYISLFYEPLKHVFDKDITKIWYILYSRGRQPFVLGGPKYGKL